MTTSSHVFSTAADFTDEEIDRENVIAKLVIEGGLQICKRCGAAEIELDQYPTCAEYRRRPRDDQPVSRRSQRSSAA